MDKFNVMTGLTSGPPPLRRPLIGIALTVCTGTFLGLVHAASEFTSLVGLGLGLLALSLVLDAGYWRLNARVRDGGTGASAIVQRLAAGLSTGCFYTAVLLTALLAAELQVRNPSGQSLSALMDKPREGVAVIGVIADDPLIQAVGPFRRDAWSFGLEVEAIHRLTAWQKARGRVQVRLPIASDQSAPAYGERWCVTGVLTDRAEIAPRPPGDQSPTWPLALPSIWQWIQSRYAFDADPEMGERLVGQPGNILMQTCYRWRRQAAEYLERGIAHRPDVVGLLQALLLGYRQELTPALRRDFTVTGTYHIFAISGQHVAILALFVIAVLQAIGVSRPRWFLYVTPALLFFTLATGLSSSAVRGCLMILLCFLGPWFDRRPDIVSAMALAAILILAYDPTQLVNYGFILSFGVVIGLIVFCPLMLAPVELRLAPDPLRLQPETRLTHWLRQAACWLAFLMVAAVAASLISAPLIAHWFNLISPIALAANLVVVPLSTLVLLAACLSVIFGGIWPLLGEIFNFANVVLVTLLLTLTRLLARVPGAWWFVSSPPLWGLALWYGTLAAWVLGWGKRRLWLVGAMVMLLAWGYSVFKSWDRVSLALFNPGDDVVGLIKLPPAGDVLINCGSRIQGGKVSRFLQQQGVNRLQVLALTRADERHVGGAPALMDSWPIAQAWCTGTNFPSRSFQTALQAARRHSIPIRSVARGDRGCMGGNVAWEVLRPAPDRALRTAADSALAFCLRRGGASLAWSAESSAGRSTPAAAPPRAAIESNAGIVTLPAPGQVQVWRFTATGLIPEGPPQELR